MQNFVERFQERATDQRSVLCVGLDPTHAHVPPSFGKGMRGMQRYLHTVIDIAAEKAALIKPQYAYYAPMGAEGLELLTDVISYGQSKRLPVILDAKRGDIGETMEQYGKEMFEVYGADAATFVPYLGPTFMANKSTDSWMPYLRKGKAVISMIRTSNPEADSFQSLVTIDSLTVYEQIASQVAAWNQQVRALTENLGIVAGVVGATYPEEAINCRECAGDDVFFLIPGYGAQGGGAEGAVCALTTKDGALMGTVNSSRGITLDSWFDRKTGVPRDGDPLELVAAAIDAANEDLNAALEAKLGRNPYTHTV